MSDAVQAPWTPEQFANICRWQATDWVHQLTCGVDSAHGALAVSTEGLECPTCGYTQTWVPRLLAEHGPPPDPRDQFGLTPEQYEVNVDAEYTTDDLKPPPKTLAQQIVELVTLEGDASFAGLARHWPEHFRDGELSLTYTDKPNLILWPGVSKEGADAFDEVMKLGLTWRPCAPMVYLIDGMMLRIPLAKRAINYKEPHWVPSLLVKA